MGMNNFDIKLAKSEDGDALAALGRGHEAGYFARCFEEQAAGKRDILIAAAVDKICGYVFLNWLPRYQPFRRLEIPEIQDLYVAPEARRQGIGEALIVACEQRARERGCTQMGIAVGLHAGFGAAQRIYVRLGYVPDGGGVTYDREPVCTGEMRPVDDELMLMLIREL